MPFGRSLAPSMLHRHGGHAEAVARISWCIDQHALGVITGEVGAGKTVAVRAATAALDTSRHAVIYLPNPSVGVRGMLHHIVSALGQVPHFYTATLVPQAADALAAEHAERGRTPIVIFDITDRATRCSFRSSCVISGTSRGCLPTCVGTSVTFGRRRLGGTASGDRQAAGAADRAERRRAVVDDRQPRRQRARRGGQIPAGARRFRDAADVCVSAG
jgi:hypothetical protein